MKHLLVKLALAVIVVATSYSVLVPGFFRVHDFTHAARIAEMSRALQDGHFPVRWSASFGYGYGMPLFEFYAPLPFYVGGILFLTGLPIIVVLKVLWILCNIITTFGSYRLGKTFGGGITGVVTAAAVSLAPYRAVNLFVRGALSEAWAIMALPWILHALVLIIRDKQRNGWKYLAVGLVVLMLSHNITTLLFLPISFLFAVGLAVERIIAQDPAYVVKKKLQLKQWFGTVVQVAGGYLLAIGLSAFYLFPAFGEKHFTKVDTYILGDYFNYKLHFLYIRQFLQPNWAYGGSAWGVDDDISFFLGWGQILGIILTGIVSLQLVRRLFRLHAQQRTQLFLHCVLFGLLGLSLFMSLLKAQPIWDALSLLKFAQFPWRWLAVAVPFVGLIASFSLQSIQSKLRLPVAFVLLVGMLCNSVYFRPEFYLDDPNDLFYTDSAKISKDMSGILIDYVPSSMPEKMEPATELVAIVGSVDTTVNSTHVSINRTQEKLIQTDFATPQQIVLALASYPGWRLEIDGADVPFTVLEGRIAVQIPAGKHQLGVVFGATPLRVWSDWISVIALSILIYLMLPEKVAND